MGIAGALVCGGRRAGSSHSAKVALLPTDFGEIQICRRPCAWIFVLFAGPALVEKVYLFAAHFAWKERQFWPSRTRSHCRAQTGYLEAISVRAHLEACHPCRDSRPSPLREGTCFESFDTHFFFGYAIREQCKSACGA